eukprot:g10979.t1
MRKLAIFCALLMLWVKGITCLSQLLDEEREAWKNIYDHWDLGKAKLGLGHKYCRGYPCNYHCTSKVVTCMETMNGNKAIFHIDFNGLWTKKINGSIPVDLGKLTHLKTIKLPYNQLRNLKKLDFVNLRNNQISDIPSSIVDMINLKVFRLSGNDLLTEPPPSVIEFCQIIRCDGINNFVWKNIYDHWDLGNHGISNKCRLDPCSDSGFEECTYPKGSVTCNYKGFIHQIILPNIPLGKTIPKAIGNVEHLEVLNLRGNNLIGLIPNSIANLKHLVSLTLDENQLIYPILPSIHKFCLNTTRTCEGIEGPPACSAFGGISSADLESCIKCTYEPLTIIILTVVIGILMVFAIRKYMQLLHDYPGAVGGTLASISILTSHAQMMSVVSRMKLSWPGKVKEAQSALNVFNLNLPAVENIWSWILTVIILIGMFGSLLIAIIYLQLWKKFFLSMKTMWRNEEIEEFDDGDDLAMSVNEGGYALLEEEELGEGGGGSAVKEGMEDEEIEEEGGNVLDENAMELTLLKQ